MSAVRNETSSEIVLYQPDETIRLEVRLVDNSVWLTQQQIAELFGVKQPAISKHLANIFKSGELEEDSVYSILEYTAADGKVYKTRFYNLDAILSVGYRVNSRNATAFRKWSNTVLKDYLLRGFSVRPDILWIDRIDAKIHQHEVELKSINEKIDFFVRTSLPPQQGIFFDGQIFDAYTLVSDLIRQAKTSVVLIDNYVDDSVLKILDKRQSCVTAKIYTKEISQQLSLDLQRHNAQYPEIAVEQFDRSHDRFLLIDDSVYHVGASLKDLGKKWFAIMKMSDITATQLLGHI